MKSVFLDDENNNNNVSVFKGRRFRGRHVCLCGGGGQVEHRGAEYGTYRDSISGCICTGMACGVGHGCHFSLLIGALVGEVSHLS